MIASSFTFGARSCEICFFMTFLPVPPYFRRMLLNMGDPTATLAAIVTASIEEATTRAFLVEVDGFARGLRGMDELVGDELEIQQLMWMVDANQSIIAEFIAIVMSSVLFIVMEPHKLVLSIGQVLCARSAIRCDG